MDFKTYKPQFVLPACVPRSGVCEICGDKFTKPCPRSMKKPTYCAKESCRKEKRRRNSEKWNRKIQRRKQYASGN
jgi:hypothetical protein